MDYESFNMDGTMTTEVNVITETSLLSPDVARATICAILTTLSISADCFCIAVLRRAKQINKITRFLMASLTLSDLCVGVFGLAPLVWSAAIGGWPEPLSQWCIIHIFTLQLFQYCGISAVLFLNLECFIAITRPLKYNIIVTKTRTLIVIAIQWSFWIIWGISMFFIFKNYMFFDHHYGLCVIRESVRKLVFVIGGAVLHIFLPVLVVICMYSRIWYIARQHVARIAERNVNQAYNQNAPRRMRDNNKAFRSFLLVTISIAVLWIPFTVVEIYETVTTKLLHVYVVSFGEFLEFSIPWINVLILFIKYESFRKTAAEVLGHMFNTSRRQTPQNN